LGYILGDVFTNSSGHPGADVRPSKALQLINFPAADAASKYFVYIDQPLPRSAARQRRKKPAFIQGCQIFHGALYQNRKKLPNEQKMYQMVIRYPKFPRNNPNLHKAFLNRRPLKITQIGIFGLKNNHLATLLSSWLIYHADCCC
jgi:hypothetical protein